MTDPGSIQPLEEPYRLLFERNPLPMWVYDRETLRFLAVNDAAVAHYGYSREEFLSRTILDIRPPEDARGMAEWLKTVPPTLFHSAPVRHVKKDGSVVEVEITSHELPFAGRPARLVVAVDQTERRRAETELREIAAGARCLFWRATVVERDNEFQWDVTIPAEDAFRSFLPVDAGPGESYARAFDRHKLPEDAGRMHAYAVAAMRAGRRRYEQEYRVRRADGSIRWLHEDVRVEPVAPGCWRLTGVTTDVTGPKQLEEQLRQAQKLDAIGRLAGGIAHEFNNILMAITGYSELVIAGLAADSPVRRQAEEIFRAGQRAAALTRQLLAFGRVQLLAPKVLDLNETAARMRSMLRPLLGERNELRAELDPNLGRVYADPEQLEQVIAELVLNAREAMPDGGTVTLATHNVELDESFAAEHAGARPGPHVLLEVRDTGRGMDEATRAHLFEPFFTTKDVGEGAGLGLATVFGFVKQSGGNVWVESEPGNGTAIRIYLPRLSAEEIASLTGGAAAPGGRRRTILVVEDDAVVAQVIRDVLEMEGYRVHVAPGGDSALALAAGLPGGVDLLVTDVVMPGLCGSELAERLRGFAPALQVLYTSGHPDELVVRYGVLPEQGAFLRKPFAPPELTARVRDLLEAAPGGGPPAPSPAPLPTEEAGC